MTDHAELGRAVVQDGRLAQLREQLGMSRNAIAEALLTSPITYSSWEAYPDTRLWNSTAERIGAFYESVTAILETVDISSMVPLYYLASELGIPQEELMRRFRAGEYHAEDLGPLGLWISQSEYDKLCGRD